MNLKMPQGATHVGEMMGNYYLEREDGNFFVWNEWDENWHPSPAANRGEIKLTAISKPADLPVTPEEDRAWAELSKLQDNSVQAMKDYREQQGRWTKGEERMRNIASNGNDGIAYDITYAEREALTQKQSRYTDAQGDDWIDECARTMKPEQFRGAMMFTIGKYNRRMGKKDDLISEICKMRDYCDRWIAYEGDQ